MGECSFFTLTCREISNSAVRSQERVWKAIYLFRQCLSQACLCRDPHHCEPRTAAAVNSASCHIYCAAAESWRPIGLSWYPLPDTRVAWSCSSPTGRSIKNNGFWPFTQHCNRRHKSAFKIRGISTAHHGRCFKMDLFKITIKHVAECRIYNAYKVWFRLINTIKNRPKLDLPPTHHW